MKDACSRWHCNRGLRVLTGLLCLVAWNSGGASAQQVESLPLPPVAGQSGDPSGSDDDYEVLARGPIHEAFADPPGLDTDAVLVAPTPPPPPVQEQPPEAQPTGKNVIWIPGYWSWDDQEGDYIYVSGLWRDVPPGRRWTPGYWHEIEGGYQWQPGFWISETRQEVAYLPPPPETLEVGPNIAAPSDDHFWIPGCWQYVQEDYAWRPGFWSPIHSGWIWVPAHYVPTAYGYVYVDGYWDYEPGNRGLLYASVIFHRPVYLSPTYYYRPRYALGNPAALLVNLFIRPNYGMYYYGNYYSPYYYDRGYQPWYLPLGGRTYVSPLVSYYRWKYARRGVDFYDRMDLWRERYESYGPDRRLRTYEPRPRASIASGIASPLGGTNLELISSMDSLVRERGSRFTRVEPNQRQQYENLSREIRSIADLRRQQNLEDLRPRRDAGDRLDRSDIGGRDSDFRRDRSRANFTLPESYRMGRPSIDGDRRGDGVRGGREGDRNADGRPGRGIGGARADGDSPRTGSGMLAPGGIQTPDFDSRRPGNALRAPGNDARGNDSRRLEGGLRVPDRDAFSPGRGLRGPSGETQRPGRGVGIPDSGLQRPGGGLRVPERDALGPGRGLRVPDSGLQRPGGELRIPGGELRGGPGSSLRSPPSRGRPDPGINRGPSLERSPLGRPGGDRSGGLNSRSLRGPEMGSSRSLSPGGGIEGLRRNFGSGDPGRAESRGRGNRGGDEDRGGGGNRGRGRDR